MLAIGKDLTGSENVEGMKWSPATQECIDITVGLGLNSPVKPGDTPIYGSACAMLRMFVLAAQATTPLTRAGLPKGLATLGKVDLSFVAGPADFRDPANPTGGQFWRAFTYKGTSNSCTCSLPIDGTFHPEFKP